MLVQRLPDGGTWTRTATTATLHGTGKAETLEAVRGEPSTIIGRGKGDHLIGHVGPNVFKYLKPTDSLASDPDRIFNFSIRDDIIDLSSMLARLSIKANVVKHQPKKVGEVQFTHQHPQGVGVLTMKLTPNGENFTILVHDVELTSAHVKFEKVGKKPK